MMTRGTSRVVIHIYTGSNHYNGGDDDDDVVVVDDADDEDYDDKYGDKDDICSSHHGEIVESLLSLPTLFSLFK